MNFLAHLYLSGDNPEIITGNLMGDFSKGRLPGGLPVGVARGILLHRRIDSFVQGNSIFRQSRERLDPSLGLYRGLLVDVFYDHFLVVDWNRYHPQGLDSYLVRTREMVEPFKEYMPLRLQELLPVIFEELLPSYGSIEGIAAALRRMAGRVSRPNPLAGAEVELLRNYDDLRTDFGFLLSQLVELARVQLRGWYEFDVDLLG